MGKGKYLKRISIHGRGKSGVRVRPRCRLTVTVKEMNEDQERTLQELREKHNGPGRRRKLRHALMPHRLILVGKKKEKTDCPVPQQQT